MRSSAALLIAVALSVSAVPVPKKNGPQTTYKTLTLREPRTLNVYKHRHFDASLSAPQRRDDEAGHHGHRHHGHGQGHWTEHGTWTHTETGPFSSPSAAWDGSRRHRRPGKDCGPKPADPTPPTDTPTPPPQEPTPQEPEQPQEPQEPEQPQVPQEPEQPQEPQPQEPQPQEPQPQEPQPQEPQPQEPAPPPEPEQPPAPSNPDAEAYLSKHNEARAKRGDGRAPLQWDENLATLSKKWVDGCSWGHSRGSLTSDFGYGENLAAGTGDYPAQNAVESWNNEEAGYDPGNPMGAGHWTQVVWKTTTHVGCAWADCGAESNPMGSSWGGWRYHSCMYTPPGNFGGEFDKNV